MIFLKLKATPFLNKKDFFIISLEDLLLTKIFAKTYSDLEKHSTDVTLIIKGIEKKITLIYIKNKKRHIYKTSLISNN